MGCDPSFTFRSVGLLGRDNVFPDVLKYSRQNRIPDARPAARGFRAEFCSLRVTRKWRPFPPLPSDDDLTTLGEMEKGISFHPGEEGIKSSFFFERERVFWRVNFMRFFFLLRSEICLVLKILSGEHFFSFPPFASVIMCFYGCWMLTKIYGFFLKTHFLFELM